MKKLHRLIIGSFVGPFILTFFVMLFILEMQFIWKYVDDFMGKGLEWYIIVELLFYVSANLVTMALPLAILLSSIMTFGNLAENYELVAMKASGLSLSKIMRPMVIAILLISAGAFYFSNNISPIANHKFRALLWDVTKQRPAVELNDGVFYGGIDGFSIRVKKNNKETGELTDILIYNHADDFSGNRKVIRAESGHMNKTANDQFLVLTLLNGYSYDEIIPQKKKNNKEKESYKPHLKSHFSKDIIRIDLKELAFSRTNEGLFKGHHSMLTISQLNVYKDSLTADYRIKIDDYNQYLQRTIFIQRDSTAIVMDTLQLFEKSYLSDSWTYQRGIIEGAINRVRNTRNYIERTIDIIKNKKLNVKKYQVEWHRKFTLSFACIVLFFIGAPLGAIIRKGGFGLPVVFSILFFLIYHIISISAEKMALKGVLTPFEGMWASAFLLSPIGVFLTYKAATDSALLDISVYRDFFKKLLNKKDKTV
ncbi:MAG: lipopolysaccharide export system permease protein [Flavobacteriales bacterium]